jgi:hypothetical protein
LIKEKAHLSIRKKKLKGLRAAGQKQHTKLHNNTYKIKNIKIKMNITSEESLGKKESTEED